VAAARLSGVAAAVLGWRPDEFWRATPAELGLALEPPGTVEEPPERAAIEELRRRFPD
jgi:uncharacterized phage protein (TIGR02216 family)